MEKRSIGIAIVTICLVTTGSLVLRQALIPDPNKEAELLQKMPVRIDDTFSRELAQKRFEAIVEYDKKFPNQSQTATQIGLAFRDIYDDPINQNDFFHYYQIVHPVLSRVQNRDFADGEIRFVLRKLVSLPATTLTPESRKTALTVVEEMAIAADDPQPEIHITAVIAAFDQDKTWLKTLVKHCAQFAKTKEEQIAINLFSELANSIETHFVIEGEHWPSKKPFRSSSLTGSKVLLLAETFQPSVIALENLKDMSSTAGEQKNKFVLVIRKVDESSVDALKDFVAQGNTIVVSSQNSIMQNLSKIMDGVFIYIDANDVLTGADGGTRLRTKSI